MKGKMGSLKISSDPLDELSVSAGRDSIDDLIDYVARRFVTDPVYEEMRRLSNVNLEDNYWRGWYDVAVRIQRATTAYPFDFNEPDAT